MTNIHLGVSENVVYPCVPNGSADHYPYEKWLFHWEYTQHFQTNPNKLHKMLENDLYKSLKSLLKSAIQGASIRHVGVLALELKVVRTFWPRKNKDIWVCLKMLG